ncbi:MAG: flavodoxin [Kiritimatiellia bacterium]
MDRRTFIKRIVFTAGMLAFGLGCTKAETKGEDAIPGNGNAAFAASNQKGDNEMKTAVIYYSWGGNTRFAAETIARKAGGDLYEIQPETPYPASYGKCCDEAKPECRGKLLRSIKPIAGLDLSAYDLVFVGTPNWWGTMAPPVRTWVTQNKEALKDKKVCLFQTNGGGGMQRVGKDFAEIVGDVAKVLPPEAFSGSSIKSRIVALETFVRERIAVK